MSKTKQKKKNKLMNLYGCRCLLTGIQTNDLTRHHIIKKEHGGSSNVNNLALIIKEIHQWLHHLEHCDIELYILVNECLELFKKCIDADEIDLINQYEEEIMPLMLKKISPIDIPYY